MVLQNDEASKIALVISHKDGLFNSAEEEWQYIRSFSTPVVEIDGDSVERWRLNNRYK